MKPLRLRATNFRTYRTLDLEFHEGLVGVLGELRDAPDGGADSNGSGKSSLLEAIEICLFGRRSLAGFLTRGGDVTDLMLELTFEHAGSWYRVRRTYSARTKAGKTTVDFERAGYAEEEPDVEYSLVTPVVYTPLTRSSSKETDQLIVETIGLTRDTYRNSSYLRQGDGSYADPARDPKQRKDLLVEAALGRDPVWPKLLDEAKASRRIAQTELERIAGETRAARELVDTKQTVIEEYVAADNAQTVAALELEQAEKDLQTVTDRYTAARDAAARRQTVEAELTVARTELERLQHLSVAYVAATTAIDAARTEIEMLSTVAGTDLLVERERELLAAIAEHENARRAHLAAKDMAEGAEARRAQYLAQAAKSIEAADAARIRVEEIERSADVGTCDHCGQALTDEARSRSIASYIEHARAADEAARTHRTHAESVVGVNVPPAPEGEPPTAEFAAVRAQLAAAAAQQQQRARLEERIVGLQRDVDARPAQESIEAATGAVLAKVAELDAIEPVNLQTIETAGALCRANVTAARAALDHAKTTRVRLDERLAQITAAEQQLAAAATRETELQALVDEYTVVEKACGRDGIPALIIENRAIPYIEAEATRILGELGTSFRVELRTQAALKSGDGLRDTLEVVVIDPDGNEAEFAEGTSGGEQTRIGLALRIALARLLASRRGAESRLLALDEPSYLDAAGMTALLKVLRGLQDEFPTILLVSHVPELRDSLDDAIVVVKDGGRSRIAGAVVHDQVEELAA